jgi:hypothetical protein
MSPTQVPPIAASDGGGARAKARVGPSSPWTAGRVAAVVVGSLLGLFALLLVGAGGTALWADRTQREDGYATTELHEFSTGGAALATVPADLGSPGAGWLYSAGVLGKVRVRVTPTGDSSSPLFVGIARSADVDHYLAGVDHTVITEFWKGEVENRDGGSPPSAPAAQSFWAASDSGPGTRTVVWDPSNGSWTVVVMKADGRPGVAIEADLGAKVPALPWIGLGVLIAGAVFLAGGLLLILGAVRRTGRRDSTAATAASD